MDDGTDPPLPPEVLKPTGAEPATQAEPDDSGLWPAEDPGWADEPGYAPDHRHHHEPEDITTMEAYVLNDGCLTMPDDMRQPAALLDPGRIYLAVAYMHPAFEPVTDMLRVRSRALPRREAVIDWALVRPPPGPGFLPRLWPS